MHAAKPDARKRKKSIRCTIISAIGRAGCFELISRNLSRQPRLRPVAAATLQFPESGNRTAVAVERMERSIASHRFFVGNSLISLSTSCSSRRKARIWGAGSMPEDNSGISRRRFGKAAAAALGFSALGGRADSATVRRNISSFKTKEWENYFADLVGGAILVDTTSRALHFWSEEGSDYRLYPTSVPLSPELTRLGRTEVVKKVVGPDWSPTPAMLERNPEWPHYVPPGPDNPMGTHALYLSWRYY